MSKVDRGRKRDEPGRIDGREDDEGKKRIRAASQKRRGRLERGREGGGGGTEIRTDEAAYTFLTF